MTGVEQCPGIVCPAFLVEIRCKEPARFVLQQWINPGDDCFSMISSDGEMNAWCGHSPHFTFGLPQVPFTHSLEQAGEYPERPAFLFSHRTGKTSGRPANRRRNNPIFSADEELLVTGASGKAVRSPWSSLPTFLKEPMLAMSLLLAVFEPATTAASMAIVRPRTIDDAPAGRGPRREGDGVA
jgi:hypothetical protein